MSDLFKLIAYFLRSARGFRSRAAVIAIVLAGVASGVASTSFIALINQAINRGAPGVGPLLGWFVALVAFVPLARFTSNALLVRVSQSAFHDMRMHLCRSILAVPLRDLERLGSARLLASLTEDVGTIGNALGALPMLAMHVSILACCLIYMGWLSGRLLALTGLFLAVGLAAYLLPVRLAGRHFRLMRQTWDSLFRHLRGLTEGTKELKLHRERRASFLSDFLESTSRALYRHTVAGNTILAAATGFANILAFVLIGTILFAVPRLMPVETQVVTGFCLAILYMLNPLDMVAGFLPVMSRANIAVRRIEEISGSLAASVREPLPDGLVPASSWNHLQLAGVTHTYVRERGEERFTLGPIDLAVEPGELIFLVGGNGSGKTTLAKLITGLYVPEQGEIRINGDAVGADLRDHYRQHFSAVFQDFFLFDYLHGLAAPEIDQRARAYLRELQLEREVTLEGGRLSTLALSQGQRKRLALLTAYLEDRPIYLFDEWAADQDPDFKRLFYLKLLPELRARGKTIIAISHDDHYYELADRIVKLDDGRVEFDGPVAGYLEMLGERGTVDLAHGAAN